MDIVSYYICYNHKGRKYCYNKEGILLSAFNQQFITSVLIIGLGYFLKRMSLLKEADGSVISRIIFNLTLPALIIVSFHDMNFELSLIILVILGFAFGVILAIVGILVFKNEPQSLKGMLVMMLPGMNIGLFAYPLVEGIWGLEGIKYFGLLDAGNAFIVFGLTYLLGSYYASSGNQLTLGQSLKKLTNSVPLMMYITVFLINIMNIPIPSFIVETASTISLANMPLSLLLLGLYLNFNFDRQYKKLLVKYVSLRYGVSFLLALLIYLFLPVSEMIRDTLVIGLCLPIPLSVIPYAEELKYDKRFIGVVSNTTMLISFFLIWFITNLIL